MTDKNEYLGLPAESSGQTYHTPARGEGYCPHNGMGYFTCPNCGCGEWVSYPQSGPSDRSKTWTWEYHCARCGKMMGLTLKGDE